MKTCSTCKIEKPLTEFYSHKGKRTSPGYLNPTCKVCCNERSYKWAQSNPEKVKVFRRRAKLKQKYDISLEEYDHKLKEQQGLCAICMTEHKRRPLNVDHNHTTGQVRGLLCDKCNMSLGLLNDSKEQLKAMLNYLEKYD